MFKSDSIEEVSGDSMRMTSGKAKETGYSSPDEDMINHPTHYQSYVKGLNIEAFDCMRAAFGDEAVKGFCICNALKYIYRCYSKGGNRDISKAKWYLDKFTELGGCE